MTRSLDRVAVEIRDSVAYVHLNRPDKLNALDLPMFHGLRDAGLRIIEDESVRAVVLSGRGDAFCAGLDYGQFSAIGAGLGSEAIVIDDSRLGGAKGVCCTNR